MGKVEYWKIEYWKIEVAVFLPLPHPKHKTCVLIHLKSNSTHILNPNIIDNTEMANNCMSFT